jgi:hypothetical protein
VTTGQSDSAARLFDVGETAAGEREDLERFAVISRCERYRYALSRAWTDGQRYVMFVGLNPSTADGMVEDPTLRRCIRFARDWGYDGLWLGNLYALRSPYPQELRRPGVEPVGPKTDHWLAHMRERAQLVVAAWGADPAAAARVPAALELLGDVHCLGVTKDGAPRHPLYLRADAPLQPWTAARPA